MEHGGPEKKNLLITDWDNATVTHKVGGFKRSVSLSPVSLYVMQRWPIRLEDLLDLLASLEPGPMTELLAFIDLAHFLPPVLCFLYSHGPSSMVYSIFTFRANM